METKLTRTNNKKIKKLFIVGNGCIENGTDCLKKLITECEDLNTRVFRCNATKLSPMHSLSCLAAEERQFLAILASSLNEREGNPIYNAPKVDNKPGALHALALIASSASFRLEMGKRYEECPLIRPNPSTIHILKKLGLFDANSAIITTNWDNYFWNMLQIQNIAHLHGRCSFPMSMIFPTETIYEYQYHAMNIQPFHAKLSAMAIEYQEEELLHLFNERYLISNQEYSRLFIAENYFADCLSSAEELYLCGIAFNDYDHELANSIGTYSQNNHWNKIGIVSLARRENEKIELASGLLRTQKSKIDFIEISDSEQNQSKLAN